MEQKSADPFTRTEPRDLFSIMEEAVFVLTLHYCRLYFNASAFHLAMCFRSYGYCWVCFSVSFSFLPKFQGLR